MPGKIHRRLVFKLHTIFFRLLTVSLILFAGAKTSAQAPVVAFTASPLSGCSPLVVNFQNQTTGTVTAWLWNFGNGNTSTLQNPTATYFTPGTYTVSLTATNATGSNTVTKTAYITVYESPTVNFSASVTSGCFPLRVQFTDMSTAGAGNTNVSWFWDFGDGNVSTAQNPLAVYTTAGTFSVTLKIINDKGCVRTVTKTSYITVGTGVDASFTNSAITVCRAPATINFTNATTGPGTLSYFWDFDDGNTSSATNPSHTFATNGIFNVMLVGSSSAGCIDTFYRQVVIGGFNTQVNATDTACINQLVSFNNGSVPSPLSSSWSFGDGGTASTINTTHTYTTAGTYTVWLYNTYSSCVDSTPHTIYISPKPPVDFTAPVTSRCQPPLTVNFQDLTPNSVGWFWDFGDGGTSTLQNPSHTYNSYGTFSV
jgi:PKD repeat protein